jgi:hypothetical protein
VTQGQLIIDSINDGVNVAFIVTLLFPLVGLPRIGRLKLGFWPWYKSDWGWNMVAFDACVSLALLPIWAHRALNLDSNSYFFGWMEAASIWLIPAIVLWRVFLIWQAQRHP